MFQLLSRTQVTPQKRPKELRWDAPDFEMLNILTATLDRSLSSARMRWICSSDRKRKECWKMTPWFNMGFNMVYIKNPLESMGLVCLPAATMKKSTINVKVNYTIHGSYGYRNLFSKIQFSPTKKNDKMFGHFGLDPSTPKNALWSGTSLRNCHTITNPVIWKLLVL